MNVVCNAQELAHWCWQYCREQDARAAVSPVATRPPPGAGDQQALDAAAHHQVRTRLHLPCVILSIYLIYTQITIVLTV